MSREIVLDTETTGFDPRTGDRMIEVGCIEIEDLLPTGRTFHRLINPERLIPADAGIRPINDQTPAETSACTICPPKLHLFATPGIHGGNPCKHLRPR